MQNNEHKTIYRKDYLAPAFLVEKTDLFFSLEDSYTTVVSEVVYYRNPERAKDAEHDLVLDGESMELLSVSLDGKTLSESDYLLSDKALTIFHVPERFSLKISTQIEPDKNTSLEGLYRTSGNYCTQCEAEGFRKITYYQDRPCVLAPFTTRIEAARSCCSIMLSNGNKVEEGEMADGKHFVVWSDPHPKPSYLFALVAGDLVALEDHYTTTSGRNVLLQIWVEKRNAEKCAHAMESLKNAMKWDEDVFGLEYDLDIYMVVAVDDFNMGAMENKGLNVFNSKYVLALPESATDRDYLGIEGVIAHEYFHNWTGNRVTCRDWFQLSLKEGLTVFRDQEFSSDLNSRAVQRIDDVKLLRDYQFKEDASAIAHPIRPDSYVEINNFYTSTVYNKGAEVIRMIHTLLGADGFRAGMDLYISRHDGQAVTCDDFVTAMEDASGVSLTQFRRWYSQAGTPRIKVIEQYDATQKRYTLTLSQSCPATPGQAHKDAYHMPVAMGLLDGGGNDMLPEGTRVLHLTERTQTFVFDDLAEKPVLSLFRGFSAPVIVEPFQSEEDLLFLMAHDTDSFNRWDAAQRLYLSIIPNLIAAFKAGEEPQVGLGLKEAVQKALVSGIDPALLAQTITLPAERYLASQMEVVDVENIYRARKLLKKEIASTCVSSMKQMYESLKSDGPYSISSGDMGKRALKNVLLSYLVVPDETYGSELCVAQYKASNNMTDTMAALVAICDTETVAKDELLADFYKIWREDPLVMDKWLSIQALSEGDKTLDTIKALMEIPEFSMKNPNKVRSLIGAFASMNHYRFHAGDGSGYQFIASIIVELNAINPQIAARMVPAFSAWRSYDEHRKEMMGMALDTILAIQDLSKDVYEVASKIRKG